MERKVCFITGSGSSNGRGMAIRLAFRHMGGPDSAACTGFVLHHDIGIPMRIELIGYQAPQKIDW